MLGFKLISFTCLLAVASAQDYQEFREINRPAPLRIGTGAEDVKPTPVPILKQINRHNEDGSYTYGYEGGDGSFKIETKLTTGEVKGKYGYTDETGKVRVVEYGANKYGFQPSGEGITVAPPTLVDETTDKNGNKVPDYDEDYQNVPVQRPQKAKVAKQPRPAYQEPVQQYFDYEQPQQQYQRQPQPQQAPRPKFLQQSPVPQRPQIANAVPIDVVYSQSPRPQRPEQVFDVRPQQFPGAAPAPVQQHTEVRFAPQPQQQQQQHYAPAPASRPNPPSFAPAPRPAQARSTSVLDQLAKDFALPQGGSPALHDISFGYY